MESTTINQLIFSHKLDRPEVKQFFEFSPNKSESLSIDLSQVDKKVHDFIRKNLEEIELMNIKFSTSYYNDFDNIGSTGHQVIVNTENVNNIRYLNKYFELVNLKLKSEGKFVGCVQTYANRKELIKKKYPKPFVRLIFISDFLFNRIIPKLPFFKKIYFSITKGRRRVLSRAETFGRLYSCGFEVLDFITHNNRNYFVAQKKSTPTFDLNPTYGPLISLKRVGRNKKLFKVYKLRTMHPYSEYLQEYIYKKNSLREGGKFKNDFRVSPEGRVLRKFWIDEIPMLINVIKGDMKLVGVRPLSKHYFSLYSEELQDLRTEVKPGFIPPFYADNPKNLQEIMESEKKYLLSYKKSPFRTDLDYLVKSLNNVLFKGFRSF